MSDTEMPAEEPKRGRGRPRAFDRERALGRAMKIFWERGFEGASLEILLGEMEISPSSLYAAFGDKEGLFTAAIDHYLGGTGGYFGPILQEKITAKGAFRRLGEAVAIELTRVDQPTGCMLSLSLSQSSPSSERVAAWVRQRRDDSLSAFEARLRQAIDGGELPPETDARELARFYLTLYQGMSIQARDGASRESLLATAAAAMRAWPDP